MGADGRLVTKGIAATLVVGMVTIWYKVLGDQQQALVQLYTSAKVSDQEFAEQLALIWAGRLLPLFLLALAILIAILYWQRERFRAAARWARRAWPYLWPPLVLVSATAVVTLTSPRLPTLLVACLGMSIALAVALSQASRFAQDSRLIRAVLSRLYHRFWQRKARDPWVYDLVQSFRDERAAVYATDGREGMVAEVVRHIHGQKDLGDALRHHPPWDGDAVIQYTVSGIYREVMGVKLEGTYGILEGFIGDDGEHKICNFPGKDHENNTVHFEVRINGRVVLRDDMSDQMWVDIQHDCTIVPHTDLLIVELRTNANGDPHFNWAAWKGLRLVECV